MTRTRHSVGTVLFGLMAACIVASGTLAMDAGASPHTGVNTVKATGTSSKSGKGPAAAREQAIANSLDAAVYQVVATDIPADTLAAGPQAVKAALSGKTQRFIDHYKVLKESESDETYQVVAVVTVSVLRIKKELRQAGILLEAKVLPKVLFLTSQQNVDDIVPRYWWSGTAQEPELVAENAMIQAVREKGFLIISNRDSRVRTTAAARRYTPHLDNQEAVDLGARTGADVVVVGRSVVRATPAAEGETVRSYMATASLRALKVDSAVQLASATKEFIAEDSDDLAGGRTALTGAGAAAGTTLATQLLSAWRTEEKTDSFLRLEVEGTRALADFVRFRKILKETNGVNEILIERLMPNSSVIAVGFNGSAEVLARALMANRYGAFTVNIYEITRKSIKLQLIGSAGNPVVQ